MRYAYRNGTKTREMLPLWKLVQAERLLVGVLGGAVQKSAYRNGTEMREMLPLWWGALGIGSLCRSECVGA